MSPFRYVFRNQSVMNCLIDRSTNAHSNILRSVLSRNCHVDSRRTQTRPSEGDKVTPSRSASSLLVKCIIGIIRNGAQQKQEGTDRLRQLLLMGSEGVGKTSMHSVIFANYPAKDTSRIGYTIDRSEQKFKFMGNLTLNLWDCGGQKNFMRQYFTTYK